jgi:hypothetical protein
VIQLPRGAFADSTWQLAPGGSASSGPGMQIGNYNYRRPANCGTEGTTGPGVDIGGGGSP